MSCNNDSVFVSAGKCPPDVCNSLVTTLPARCAQLSGVRYPISYGNRLTATGCSTYGRRLISRIEMAPSYPTQQSAKLQHSRSNFDAAMLKCWTRLTSAPHRYNDNAAYGPLSQCIIVHVTTRSSVHTSATRSGSIQATTELHIHIASPIGLSASPCASFNGRVCWI
jgi:hypothetical protein